MSHVDVKEAYHLQAGEGYVYIDVRSIPEYERGHSAGAHNVPLLHVDAQTGRHTPVGGEFVGIREIFDLHTVVSRSHPQRGTDGMRQMGS